MKRISSLTLALILVLGTAGAAQANSRFTVINNWSDTVKVTVYDGSDSVCTIAAKSSRVKAGETRSFGCKGQGKQRCKVAISKKSTGDPAKRRYCIERFDTCNKDANIVKNGSTITLSGGFDEPDCEFDIPDK